MTTTRDLSGKFVGPRPQSQAQEDAARFAFTREERYATPAELDELRDDGVARVLRHLAARPSDRRHDPEARRRRACELLAYTVEKQLRATPGGRTYLRTRPIVFPWQ